MTLVWGWDATHANLGSVPAGQGAGYATGSGDVPWTQADWDAHPGAIRIDQDANAADPTADVLDVETNAATPAEVAGWVTRARAAFAAGTRPGQRWPCIYVNRSNQTAVANNLAAHTISGAVPFWLADPDLTMDQAGAMVTGASGPYPIVGVQFADRGAYDSDVWDSGWLDNVSAGVAPSPSQPPADTFRQRMETMPEISEGMAGNAVRTCQALLFVRGFHLGTTGQDGTGIDGTFGPLTHAAVIAFQQEQKIADDGVVGPVTWPLLPLS